MREDDATEVRAAPATLGDVLYAHAGQVDSEREWVALVRSIAAGDERALETLYDRAQRIVFTLTMRISNDRETAEELTLDVFHDVWRRAPTYDPRAGTVVGWIMNQARSRAIDRLRHDQRKKRVNPHAGHAEPPVAGDDSPEGPVERAQQARTLRDALATLTANERLAIETAYFSGMSYSQVAVRLNEPPGTIKTRIRSGLGKLRQTLGPQGKGQ
ncbi:MAG TPA: sigma-70 family RNA polymerase sigma factor [Gammaproteobacteria bacterium]|nr:sigma-70 family RNA polymerase sigma factor [Gammaproteobacteria bacterium]